MGNSILQNLARSVNGLLLLESFESVNFVQDQGWTLLNGLPVNSNDTAFSGLRSFKMDLSYPQIEKTTTAFNFSVGYFRDDSAIVAGNFQPFIKWIDSGGAVWALGVNDSVSAVFYTKIINGVASATAIPRTTAWHRFSFVRNSGAATAELFIDNVSVGSAGALNSFTKIQVGARVYAGTPAFGYFDLIQVCSSANFVVSQLENGQAMTLLESNGTTVIASAVAAAGAATVSVATLNQPLQAIVKITKADGIRPFFLGPENSISGGDNWNLNVFDLGRRVSTFRKGRPSTKDDKESSSGKNQTLFYFSRDTVGMTFTDLTDAQVNELQRWWGYAKSGGIFSAAIDSEDLYAGLLTAATGATGSVLAVGSAVGANRNSRLMVIEANGQHFEVGEVLSIAAANITLKEQLVQQYSIGALVRHNYYWPAVITTDSNFEPALSNSKLKRWMVSISFKEAL